ncbi:MAG: hypothetical protein GY720_01020, partial [bacterium]|nr:hypothetical protein [bacterium]
MDTPLPRRSWPSQVRLLFVSLLTSAAMLAATPAAAATNTVVDCDSQSLQAAVDAAKPGDVLDIVNVPCSEDVTVNKNLTIRGDWPLNPEAGVSGSIAIGSAAHVVLENLEVSGNYGHRAITTAGTVTIRNSQLYGGGLAIEGGVATLIDSVVQESVSEFAQGGGIYSCGELSLTGGWIGDNFADEGAGIYVACGETTIVGTSLGENGASHGGAVFVAAATDPTVTITDSELTHNEGYQTGGAIHVAGGSVTVVSSRITDNIAEDGGGIYNVGGDVTVTSSLVQGNTAFVEPAFTEPILQTQRLSGPGPHLLEDVHIETTNGPCVEVSAGSEVTIRNVELGPCGAEGIVIDHSSGVDVHDSFIHPESTGESGVAIRATHSSDIEVTGNVLAHGSSNLFAFVVSDLRVADNLFVNPLGPYPTNKQIQVWGEPQTDGLNDPDLVNSIVVTIEDNVLITSVDPKWGPRPDPGDAINLGYTIDAEVTRNHIIGGHGFQACGIITDHATVSGARILDNVLVGTAQCGIGIAGGEDIEVSGNSILNGHVNTPYPGGNVAMYAHNFYASETPTCDAITIEGNTAAAVFRDGSYRNFDHPPAGSSGICTDAVGQPVTRAAVAADNVLGEGAAALLDPAYRTRPIPYLPPQTSRDLVVSPYVAGPGRPNGNGGGIYNTGGHVDIVESEVSDNTATNSGGGLYNGWLGSIDADHSRISGNAATSGGGVANSGGSVTVRRSR